MAMWIGARRVLDPMDERIKARFCCSGGTSGSEHDGEVAATGAASSSSLSHLIDVFFEPDDPLSESTYNECDRVDGYEDSAADDPCSRLMAVLLESVQDLLNDPFRRRLYSEVIKASERLAVLRSSGPGYRRAAMARLRDLGYDAGVCKARWEGSGGLAAGDYEYIDVLTTQDQRYIVDLDFASQFEVARAAAEYKRLIDRLPRVMMCKAEGMRRVVRIMAEAARRSLKSKGLSVPPWRKSRYMLAKWLGPYRRTANPLPSSAGGAVVAGCKEVSKCRTIGFSAAPTRTGAILFR